MTPKRPIVIVTFDELSGGSPGVGVPVPPGYHGLLWDDDHLGSDLSSFDPSNLDQKDTGFQNGLTSGLNVAFTPNPVTIERVDGGRFSLETLNITAGWYSFLRVTFDGYRDGVLVYHRQRGLDDLAPRHPKLDFDNVDKVVITQVKGIQDPRFHVDSPQIVLDDLVFRGIAPEAGQTVRANAFGADHHAFILEHASLTFVDHPASLIHVALA